MARETDTGRVRIIGGAWRRRLLDFPQATGLRPTPDRVRETVFNWLAPYLPGAVCLDLFAGSGAFGFEALSRGAHRAVLVEQAAPVVAALRDSSARLGASGAEIRGDEVMAVLNGPVEAFDVVFVDPPYASNLLEPCLHRLATGGWLKPGAWIYLEAPAPVSPKLPSGWEPARHKTAGQVGYYLVRAPRREESA